MSSNFEYSSYSGSSSTGGAAGGADANGIFSQVDTNRDGSIDRAEFSNWIGNSLGAGQAGGAGAGFGSSSYESSSFSASGGGAFGAEAGLAGASSFESGSFGAGGALDAGSSSFQSSSFESSSSGAAGFDASAISQAAGYTSETNAAWSRYGADVRGAGLYVDANPQIIRRQAPGGVQTYTQNIKVRFLQPPPIPPPGVSYINKYVVFIL